MFAKTLDILTRGACVFVVCLLLAGCQSVSPQPGCEGNCNAEEEPNNDFQRSRVVSLTVDGAATLSGSIDVVDDVDVFDLGGVAGGDRVTIKARRIDAALRPAIALYDEEGELINEDTLTSITTPSADPEMVHTVREAHDKIYVAISHNTVRSSLGAYEIDVDIVRGGPVPPPTNQTILLSFAGGHVEDPVFGTYDVSAFDAGDIAARYQDDTDLIKNVIKQVFAQNYERFSVEIWDTDDPQAATQLAGRVYSRIVFGGFNTYAFGAAEDVDLYNANTADTAIIFTESFQPGLFNGAPSSEQLGVAIGNVAAHEMGHLLGLHHVNDATALMDEASPAYTLLDDQEFKQAPLSHSIFPLGLQDSADLLAVIVGLNADAAKLTRDASPPSAEAWTRMAKNSQAQAFSDTDPVMSKCGTCLWREALAGRGPLKDLVSRD